MAAKRSGIAGLPSFLSAGSAWDSFAFVDLCERHRGKGTPEEQLCREIQMLEWRTLFDWCFAQAGGKA